MPRYPFPAVVGAEEMASALLLTTICPEIGGVLVRGEKGTAKSTMVRALVDVLPEQSVVLGCRFGCDPTEPDPTCPDGPHPADAPSARRPARLVELPVAASEDRVTGSLDLSRALGSGEVAFEPGLLADAHRGLLYVDEVNLLHDHLVDLLLDAAAMGRNTVERDGVSVAHAARIVLIGTMNPEEGELRPQLLDRFGLAVEVTASRDPAERVEVVRRRLEFDADPAGFVRRYDDESLLLRRRIADARRRLPAVELTDWALTKIAVVCAGFEVDGMRADVVTARAAAAHAAWEGRTRVSRADIRLAAILALPHRRRRKPFDAPGLDEDLLDRLLGDDDLPDPDPEPEPERGTEPERGSDPEPGAETGADRDTGPDSGAAEQPTGGDGREGYTPPRSAAEPGTTDPAEGEETAETATTGVAHAVEPFRVRRLSARGIGEGEAGRRSRAVSSWGRVVGATRGGVGRIHFAATLVAAAPHQRERGRSDTGPVRLAPPDLRHTVTQGRESNLVLIAVDASGSMAARRRMAEVKTAVLSLLTDAYQRRDRVGVITFRGSEATLVLPPTRSTDAAARCLDALPHGGRTPLAEGLLTTARALELERIRDPRRRALVVLVTDGRATSGADALGRARRVADRWPSTGVHAVVVDCESGRMRLGLAGELAARMGAEHLPLAELSADGLTSIISSRSAA